MANIWLMKTELKYLPQFITQNVVAIDEEGFDLEFHRMTEQQMLTALQQNQRSHPQRIINFFNDFEYEMAVNDIVVIGSGKSSEFKATAIGKITGNYQFDSHVNGLRHLRSARLTSIPSPIDCGNWRCAKRVYRLPDAEMGKFAALVSQILL